MREENAQESQARQIHFYHSKYRKYHCSKKSKDIKIDNFGLNGITVSDNGRGIAHENSQLIANYACTSKIESETDLESFSTTGFRGKALHAISQLCTVNIKSFNESDPHGFEVEIGPRVERVEAKKCLRPVFFTL